MNEELAVSAGHTDSGHVGVQMLGRYARGELAGALLVQVEAHVDGCPDCRSGLADHVDPARVRAVWALVDRELVVPVPGRLERAMTRIGVPEHLARLVAATPALPRAWAAGSALVLALTVLVVRLTEVTGAPLLLLGISPVLPVAGVALSFGPRFDPTYEMALVAPMNGMRLVMLRTAVVLGTAAVLAGLASLVVPFGGLVALGWLLPMFALTLVSLVLTSRLDPVVAAGITAAGWVVSLLCTSAGDNSAFFEPAGQLAMAAVAAVAAAALVKLRDGFDREAVLAPAR